MKRFNFSERQEAVVVPFHTTEIGKLVEPEEEEPDESPEAVEARARVLIDTYPEFVVEKMATLTDEAKKNEYLQRREARIRRQCAKPLPGSVRNWLRHTSDSLIIATEFNPLAVLLELLPLLAPSAPFVIFSEYLEVLPASPPLRIATIVASAAAQPSGASSAIDRSPTNSSPLPSPRRHICSLLCSASARCRSARSRASFSSRIRGLASTRSCLAERTRPWVCPRAGALS